MLEVFILITGFLGISAMTLLVLFNNPKSDTNRRFAFLAAALAIWPVFNYFSLHNENHLLYIRIVMAIAVCIITGFYFLAITFPLDKFSFTKRHKIAVAYGAITVVAALGPWLFSSVTTTPEGQLSPHAGPAMALFMGVILFFMPMGLWSLYRRSKHARTLLERRQLQVLYWSSLFLFGSILFTNFVMPIGLHRNYLVPFGPIFNLGFVATVSYAIVKLHLFNIRMIVARSVAYSLLLVSLAGIYGGMVFASSQIFFNGSAPSLPQQIWYVVAAMFLAFTFQPLKHFFDRITSRVFFHDAYDTQEVLNALGDVVATEINLDKILTGTRNVLTEAIKSSFIEFMLLENRQPQLIFTKNESSTGNLDKLGPRVREQHKEILFREDLGMDNPLKDLFTENNVAISLRLKTQQKVVGYILIGDKRSGYIYSNQDRKLLLIAADELAIAIQNALRFREIQAFNVTLQQKIDEATTELEATNRKLKELDATKDEFISMASHQLRTPLTTIKGYLSMILEGDAGPPLAENEKVMIKRAFDGAQKMVYLIADLLNVSRLQSGKFIIENKPTNLAEVVDSEVSQLLETAKNRKISLSYQKPSSFPVVMLDENKIRQVVMNFIDNAIHYTSSGGKVTAAVDSSNGQVEFSVSDTGVGVPKKVQSKLFTKFYRADNIKKIRPDGTGLGLFMAKKVVDAQGGEILFQSEENKGSTFGFRFPIKAQAAPAPVPPKPPLINSSAH